MIAEREMSTYEASHRLKSVCQLLNLSPKIRFEDNDNLVATCSLYSPSGEEVSSGAGKGRYCELGAVAESLEHHFLEQCIGDEPEVISGARIHGCTHSHDDWLLKSVPASLDIPAFRLNSLHGDESIYVPAALLNPCSGYVEEILETEASFLTKYSSNSGMAFGCTENEALLHAINECIERHALSVYYMSVCKLMPALKLQIPSNSFLEDAFCTDKTLLAHAKKLTLFLTNEFYGAFFCIAIAKREIDCSLSVVGSGCSADPSVALYRAVSEQLQCSRLRRPKEKQEDLSTACMLGSSKRLSKLLTPIIDYPAETLNRGTSSQGMRAQIQQATEKLHEHGRSVFYRTLFNKPGLACVVQAYIPGLERFHLIRSGIPVVPQSALSQGLREKHVFL
ncbi:YcaO-like family protein [compost metagenome]